MSVDEQRIRDFAYQIWESEGRPDGQEQRHWNMAIKLAEAAEAAARRPAVKRSPSPKSEALMLNEAEPSRKRPEKGKTALLKPTRKTGKASAPGKPVE